MPHSWEVGEEAAVAAATLNLFHLLPSQASKFLETSVSASAILCTPAALSSTALSSPLTARRPAHLSGCAKHWCLGQCGVDTDAYPWLLCLFSNKVLSSGQNASGTKFCSCFPSRILHQSDICRTLHMQHIWPYLGCGHGRQSNC